LTHTQNHNVHPLDPSDCTISLGSTQPLQEISTRSITWV